MKAERTPEQVIEILKESPFIGFFVSANPEVAAELSRGCLTARSAEKLLNFTRSQNDRLYYSSLLIVALAPVESDFFKDNLKILENILHELYLSGNSALAQNMGNLFVEYTRHRPEAAIPLMTVMECYKLPDETIKLPDGSESEDWDPGFILGDRLDAEP